MHMKTLNENDSLEELLKKYGIFTQITTMEELNEYIKKAKENKIYDHSILNHIPEKEVESLPTDTKQENIKPSDIVQADIIRKISKSKIQSIKGFFQKLIDKIIGKGDRE